MKNKKIKKGFTLIEILVVSLISVIVITGTATFFSVLSGQMNFLVNTTKLESVSHSSLNLMMSDIMQGFGIHLSSNRELIIFGSDDLEAIRYKSEIVGGKYILKRKLIDDDNWIVVNTFSDEIQIDCQFLSDVKNHVSIQLILKYTSDSGSLESRSVTRDVFCRNSTS